MPPPYCHSEAEWRGNPAIECLVGSYVGLLFVLDVTYLEAAFTRWTALVRCEH